MTNTVSRTIDDDTLNRIITIESSGNPFARVATSSALGLGQFLNATWLAVVRKHSPETMRNKTDSQVLSLRTDASFSIEMLARFEEDNKAIIGAGAAPGDVYLAHFLGAGTARQLFRAPPNDPVSTVVSQEAIRANASIMGGKKTVGDVRAWAAKRMAQSGGHDWIKKYYRPMVKPVGIVLLPDTAPMGDPDLLSAQNQLKGMNYYSGELDGLWGGKTSAAISGFINDRGGFMAAPTSVEQYEKVKEQIKAELNKAEIEKFKRPVTVERKIEDPATVARIAPEIVPARKSMWTAWSGGAAAFGLAVWDTVSNWSSTLWSLFVANKDNIPDTVKDPSFLTTTFHKVPAGLWLIVVAALLAFIGVNAYRSVRKINVAVSTGER